MTATPAVRTLLSVLTLSLFAGGTTCLAQAPKDAPEPEHTVWVKLVSEPPGVDLYAPGKDEQTPGKKIGTTPCVVAIDLTWGRSWMKRRWDRIKVWTPGNVARAQMLANSNYDLTISCIAQKDGYRPQAVRATVTTLEFPGKDWSGETRWPSEQTVQFDLTSHGTARDAAAASIPPRAARRIILAGSGGEGPTEPGTLVVSANIDGAAVQVDDTQAGPAPVRVVLQEGRHRVEILKAGYQPLRKEIHVTGDTEVTYRAVLVPETE